MRKYTRNSFRRFRHGHEQSEGAARKWRKSKITIEGRRFFIPSLDYNGERRERMRRANNPTNRVGEQKFTDPFPADSLIARETSDESGWNKVVAREAFSIFARQVGDRECERTQAVESDNPTLIVDGDKNTRDITLLVLSGTSMEPIIERSHTARKFRTIMLA